MFLNVQRLIIIELTNPLVHFPHLKCNNTLDKNIHIPFHIGLHSIFLQKDLPIKRTGYFYFKPQEFQLGNASQNLGETSLFMLNPGPYFRQSNISCMEIHF